MPNAALDNLNLHQAITLAEREGWQIVEAARREKLSLSATQPITDDTRGTSANKLRLQLTKILQPLGWSFTHFRRTQDSVLLSIEKELVP